jgi:NAD(P)-dependent dehydrogenase (short-subunit alcohol dehydrogenase family)
MQETIRGKTALLTGAAVRIGRATALALAAAGVNIVLHYRKSGAEAEEALAAIMARGVKAWSVQADFENLNHIETLIPQTLKVTGGALDLLINNASIIKLNTIADMDYQSLMENVEVNAWAPFALTRDFARQRKHGSVVYIIDGRIYCSANPHAAYIASKHLLAAFTKMTAVYYAPGILINGVSPALILPPRGRDEAYLEALDGIVPLKKHGTPEDIAAAVVYLCKNDFITGQIINVDGGYHLKDYSR